MNIIHSFESEYYQASQNGTCSDMVHDNTDSILNPESEEQDVFEPPPRDLLIPNIEYTDWSEQHGTCFMCNGTVMLGRDWKFVSITLTLLTTPTLLFYFFVLDEHYSKYAFSTRLHKFTLIIILICTFFFLIKTHFTEPGYLPCSDAPDYGWSDVLPNGRKYCVTCRLWRPPRAKHCRYCKACVRNFDHHCAWVGTCIGERNHSPFTFFLFFVTSLISYILMVCLYVVYESSYHATDENTGYNQFIHTIQSKPVVFVLCIFGLFFLLTVGNLFIFHIYLIATNQTTNEYVKGTWQNTLNPYNEGCGANFVYKCCTPVPTSHIKSHNSEVDDYQVRLLPE